MRRLGKLRGMAVLLAVASAMVLSGSAAETAATLRRLGAIEVLCVACTGVAVRGDGP